MKKYLMLFPAGIIVIAMFSPQAARACVCSPGKPSALDSFERAKHVVVAKITGPVKKRSVVNLKNPSFDDRLSASGIAVMTVEKVYKGSLAPGEKVDIVHGFSDCDPVFEEKDIGREYLLYLGNPQANPPRFVIGICGRSGDAGAATEDFLYLDNLSSVKGKTRISGSLINGYGGSYFGGMKVIIRRGGKTWETTTDSNGVYEIYDLPEGKYEIEPELPDGWKIFNTFHAYKNAHSAASGRSLSVSLSRKGHISQDIRIVPDITIRGRLLSSSGKPLKKEINVGAERIDGGHRVPLLAFTDKKGKFNTEFIYEGEYVLYVDTFVATDDFPFGKLYYPGVADREKAKVFSITPGTVLSEINFRVPESEGLLKISVTVLPFNGGKLADPEPGSLRFVPEPESWKKPLHAENFKKGVFHINIPKGTAGNLYYSASIPADNFRDCPEKLVSLFPTIRTNEVWISGKESTDAIDVQLRIPAPCE